jgi:kynurenine formamidase
VDKIAPEKFFGPAVVLDVTKEAERDPDYLLSAKDISVWEQKHGNIPAGSIVILRTGWSTRWPDVARYRNQDVNGKMHFPGYSVETARILLQRKVSGLGCDTLSIDPGNSPDFPVHHLVLGAGIYQLENLADLSGLPESGAFLIAAPIKLEGGSGGAVRVFALVAM